MEARACRGQKKSPEDANQVIQLTFGLMLELYKIVVFAFFFTGVEEEKKSNSIGNNLSDKNNLSLHRLCIKMQAWQEEVECARQCQRDAENKLAIHNGGQSVLYKLEHMELEKRYRELTDLLYYKQTQLENMVSEKAAAVFQLEKELKRLQEAQVEAERSKVSRHASSSWEEDSDMKTLESFPLYHRHVVGASEQLQKAAKILDAGAARATRFLWRNPIARLMLLFYLVFAHLFLMYLLHRLQEQADSLSSREAAESMGLTTPKLP
ncbi:Golgin subfamily A member 5 [Dillenia turbinata]|uniref:Golgin subfamily A member 5 n=1 Tax=Dillenia turbinata TaxID=194707 RepID=A0AAN8W523_9MAGN